MTYEFYTCIGTAFSYSALSKQAALLGMSIGKIQDTTQTPDFKT